MGNTEEITLGEIQKTFRVFKRLPVPIARQVQNLMIEMAEDYTGPLEDLESGKVNPKEAKNIKLDVLYEIYDLLLTTCVLSPKITEEDIENIEHDLQEYFQDLSDLLLKKFTRDKKQIKKKSTS